jgi:hypothetical protein
MNDRCQACGAFVQADATIHPADSVQPELLHWSTGRVECGPQVRRNDSLTRDVRRAIYY